MITDFDDCQVRQIADALEMLKLYKWLQQEGYNPGEFDIEMSEDNEHDISDFMEFVYNLVGVKYEWDWPTEEAGLELGYNMMVDPEETSARQWVITHPEIDKYLNWAKRKGYDPYKLPIELNDMFMKLIPVYSGPYGSDTQMGFLAEDLSGFCIIENIHDFFCAEFIEGFLDIIEVCRKANKENEFRILHPFAKMPYKPPQPYKRKRRKNRRGRRTEYDQRSTLAAK